MRCEQARQLFDAYLDGELSEALETELGAHRVRCPPCRRALALLEVSGHIIGTDRNRVTLGEDFAGRLLACMEPAPARWGRRLRRGLYLAGPLVAAAVIALALLGVFDRHDTRIAGQKSVRPGGGQVEPARPVPDPSSFDPRPPAVDVVSSQADRHLLEEWLERTQKNLAAKRESGESLQKALDLTILQMLSILQEATNSPTGNDRSPEVDVPSPRPPSTNDGGRRGR